MENVEDRHFESGKRYFEIKDREIEELFQETISSSEHMFCTAESLHFDSNDIEPQNSTPIKDEDEDCGFSM